MAERWEHLAVEIRARVPELVVIYEVERALGQRPGKAGHGLPGGKQHDVGSGKETPVQIRHQADPDPLVQREPGDERRALSGEPGELLPVVHPLSPPGSAWRPRVDDRDAMPERDEVICVLVLHPVTAGGAVQRPGGQDRDVHAPHLSTVNALKGLCSLHRCGVARACPVA